MLIELTRNYQGRPQGLNVYSSNNQSSSSVNGLEDGILCGNSSINGLKFARDMDVCIIFCGRD